MVKAVIIAGNLPAKRLEKLRGLCEHITVRKIWTYAPKGDVFPAIV